MSIFEKIFPKDDPEIEDIEDESYEEEASVSKKSSSNKMVLVEPRAYSESQQIADHLKKRNSVVVNLK
ncbi:MAG: cell division protein SepF, partial [Bacilli bacterium]|nr:cell division protein SepF [Bacilli bacterium]